MFLGLSLSSARDRDQNFKTCWPLLEIGYTVFFITSLIISIICIIYSPLAYILINNPQQIVEQFQIWRLFTSFLVPGSGIRSLIGIIIDFYILYCTLPDLERKYSTAYVFFEIICQIIMVNISLVFIGYPIVYMQIISSQQVIGYSTFPLVLNFLWQTVAIEPERPTRFCFFPCLLPFKYIPWCYTILIILFGSPIVSIILYCIVSYYQHMWRKRSFIQITLSIYRKFDVLMCDRITNRIDYVKVVKVETQLKNICSKGWCGTTQQTQNSQMSDKVQVIGKGTCIGGSKDKQSKKADFKAHWKNQETAEIQTPAQDPKSHQEEDLQEHIPNEDQKKQQTAQLDSIASSTGKMNHFPLVEQDEFGNYEDGK